MDKRFAEAMCRAGFPSKDSLARALKAQAPEAFQGIEPRGLGAKIGELERGVSTWWRKRPDRVEALQVLTGFDARELVAALVQRARGRWSFPEFSTLTPLDLLEELPADLGAGFSIDPKESDVYLDAWLQRVLPASRQPPRLIALSGLTWLTVPPGCGRGLLLARLQAVGNVDVIAADSLDDAVAEAKGSRPVVLAPRRTVKQDDMEALMRLDPERPVLIVSASPCPRPTLPPELSWHPRWDWLVTTGSERRKIDLVKGNQGGAFGFSGELRVIEWRLTPDWRMRLITWLEQRLAATGDTLFSGQGFGGWLQRFDPASVWFSTPEDVMALASMCHASGERKLPGSESAKGGASLLQHLAPMDSRTCSLLLRLVELRWRDAANEWLAPMPWDDWLSLVDVESSEVADGERGKPSKNWSPKLDLESLRKENLLAADSQGWWAFALPVQARLLLRDALMRWISEGDLERWARPLVGDTQRQAVLDSVLASMPPAALNGSIKAVLLAAPGSLSALSAAEALFIALGSKFATGEANYRPELAGLPARILQQYSEACGEVWPPFTRVEVRNHSDPLSWVLGCWEWSLCAPPPPELPAELANWFPGWLPRGDDANGLWYVQLPHELKDAGEYFAEKLVGFDVAVRSAQRVVDRVGYRSLVEFAQPGPLRAALMLVAAGRGLVEPVAAWWDELLRLREAPGHLVRSLEKEDADAVATRLLPSYLEAAGSRTSSVLRVLGPIWTWLFERSNALNVLPGLPAATVFVLYGRLRGLPPSWQGALANRLGPNDPEWCWGAVLAESADPERVANRLLSTGTTNIQLLQMLWRLTPASCLAYASDPQQSSSSMLITLCPSEQSGPLADEIARRDDLLPERATRLGWVLRRLRESRGQEAGLRALLNRLELS